MVRVYFIGIVFSYFSCQPGVKPVIHTGGRETLAFRVLPFALEQVKLLEGPFKQATDLNKTYLIAFDMDRLLAKFRLEAGLTPKAAHYQGWEDQSLAGHSLGHHLSACALMYQTSGDSTFLKRVNYMVSELALCQKQDADGYIGAFTGGKGVFVREVAKGQISAKPFNLNGIWSPFYTIHKVMAGLQDAYRLTGDTLALEVNKKFADWIGQIMSGLTSDQVQEVLKTEHGGINETLVDLFAATGENRYLQLSKTFHHQAILDSMALGFDVLPGKHANTQIPKFTGIARRYELTQDSLDYWGAVNFWERVVHHHSYVTGGNCNHEYFGPADQLRNRLSSGTAESCNVYNMLKLTEHLFAWEASAEKADFYERALFNHILATQHPQSGRVIYNLSLEMGGTKVYQDPLWFTCCVGSGMENHSKYGGSIFYHNHSELFVNQFIASELTWSEKNLAVRLETKYPEQQGYSLILTPATATELTLQLRYPSWCRLGLEIRVNGQTIKHQGIPGSYIALKRTWKAGDRIDVTMPFTLRMETMPDDSQRVAILYGPLVLAGDLGPAEDSLAGQPNYVPGLLTTERDPALWLEAVPGTPNAFITTVGRPRQVTLRPFFQVHDRRYTVYWDLFTEETWAAKEQAAEIEKIENVRILEATFDFVQPGDPISEKDHRQQGEKTTSGEFEGRQNRESREGWFSYDLKIMMGQPMALVVDYFGGFPGNKTFNILVDDRIIATENISNKKDGAFIRGTYAIPDDLTVNKPIITVKFQALPAHMAGPIFGVRTIKR